MKTILKWGGLVLVVGVINVATAVLTAFPTMLLWNTVIPGVFGLPTIDFVQALVLNLLCSVLFKSSSSSSSK